MIAFCIIFGVFICGCCIGAYLISKNDFWKRQDFMEKINRMFQRREKQMSDTRTFTEVFAAVKYKVLNKLPMSTAKEELMENFIKDWVDAFGYETLK